jgi:protein-L-isoaspartate(D-aspartate) O-methyltransferase
MSEPAGGGQQAQADGAEALAMFLLWLRSRGLRDQALLKAVEGAPRELFLDAAQAPCAYRPMLLPIACGQEATPPQVLLPLLEALEVRPRDRVLEVGTGTGYQTALLGQLATEVTSVERYRRLSSRARSRMAALGLRRVHCEVADATAALGHRGPFERIIVNAAFPAVPDHLVNLLGPDGRMLVPVGEGREQSVLLIVRRGGAEEARVLGPGRFGPARSGLPQAL